MTFLIVGTAFSNYPNAVKTQGEFLYEILKHEKLNVEIVSRHKNKIYRIFDTISATVKLPSDSIIILQVYGCNSLFLESFIAFISFLRGIKVISTIHGGFIPQSYKSKLVDRFLLNTIFNISEKITCPSLFVYGHLSVLNTNVKNKGIILPNFIDLNEYEFKNREGNDIFWMRGFHDIYNPILALDTLKRIHERGFKVKLNMAGPDMGLLNEVVNYADKLGLSNFVVFHGVITTNEKNLIANSCFAYLNTTKIDNAPVSFVEMMALGLPIVSTSVGGIKYLVKNRVNALLSDSQNSDELADLLIEIKTRKSLKDLITVRNKELSLQFSKENVLSIWKKILVL